MFRDSIWSYFTNASKEHHRYRSWEHCYAHFGDLCGRGVLADRDSAALHLAFYLASWGMYRGSSFLLQHDYTIHRAVVDLALDPRSRELRRCDFGTERSHEQVIPAVLRMYGDIEAIYRPFAASSGSRQPTATLVSKIMLGVFGCLPACDRYFRVGWKSQKYPYSSVNKRFLQRLIEFCQDHQAGLQREQARIEQRCGVRYPLMKLIDMHFWQLGYDEEQERGKPKAGKRRGMRSIRSRIS